MRYISVLVVLALCCLTATVALGQVISTGKADYLPGATVTFSGSGFQANETVNLVASGNTNGSVVNASATAGGDGSINGSFVIPPVYEEIYTLVATGGSSNLTASTSFLDAINNWDRVTSGNASITLDVGSTSTFVVRAKGTGNTNVAGVVATWTAAAGSPSSFTSPATGSDGLASYTHTVKSTPGSYQIDVSGGGKTTFFSVTAVQTCTAPSITCPADITVNNDVGSCGAVVTFAATATGTSPVTITYSPASGSTFPVGTTTVTATASNACGLASCTFSVTVNDNKKPTISAPADAGYQCASGVPAASASDASASDNCSTPTVTVSDVSNGGAGSVASPLVITRTWTATDAAGNSASASQTITVIDNTAPTITAPADAGYQCASGVPAASASDASASDNCSTPTVTVSDVSNGGAGSVASPLVITRTWTATDAAGNSASASQTITVIDNTPPVISVSNVSGTACNIPVTAATASDNCDGTVTPTSSAPYPQFYPLGMTTFTWTATDANGNPSTATQTVTVTGYGSNSGFLAPVGSSARPGQVKKGSTVPVKFNFSCGYPLASGTIKVNNVDPRSTSNPNLTVNFRWTGSVYIYNLDTGAAPFVANGIYSIVATLNDGSTISGAITITK